MRESEFHSKSRKSLPEPRNLILVGMTGGGKTAIGRALAWQLGFGFLDLDRVIEDSQKKKIDEIFHEKGPDYFRDIESRCIAGIKAIRNHVIAIGGGALQRDENHRFLKELGVLVWVDTSLSTIAWRLSRNPIELKKRPLLSDLSSEGDVNMRFTKLMTRLEALLAERIERYKSAQVVLRDSSSIPETCAQRVVYLVSKYLSNRS